MLGITLIRSDLNEARYFEQGKIIIGSAASADLRLEHPSVQPEHAMIQVTEGVAVIQRAHRHANLAINGSAVTGVNVLSDAHRLRIGEVELVVQFDDPAAATKQSFDRNAIMDALKRKKNALQDSAPGQPSAPSLLDELPTAEQPASPPARRNVATGPPQPEQQRRAPSRNAPQRPGHATAGAPSGRPSVPRQVTRPERSQPVDAELAIEATNMLAAEELDRVAAEVAAQRKFPVGQGTRPKKQVDSFDDLPEIKPDVFEPYRPIESDEIDPEIVNTQRLAVSELASAFASWSKPRKVSEVDATAESLTVAPEPAHPPPEKAAEAPTSMLSGKTAFPTGIPVEEQKAPLPASPEENPLNDPLELGQASELHTQELTSEQVASLYMLFKKRKAEKKQHAPPAAEETEEAPADESDEDFSLQNILLEGPQAFGVKTWEEVAAEAAEFQEPEAHYGENRLISMMSKDGEDTKLRQMVLGTVALAVVAFTILLLMTPDAPKMLGEESEGIQDLDISGLTHLEHRKKEIRCFTEAECKAMAARALSVAKKEWEDRDAHYDNRFRAFEHVDRARVMLESQGLESSAIDGLQDVWEETRAELDTIYKGLRVSFHIAMSRKRYEDAFNVIQLTKMFFPSPRAREFRWAEHLRLALKEKGVEAEVNHKRAVRGRWN